MLTTDYWEAKMNKNDDLVWYVSYGSNMLKKRFMCYLTGDLFPGMGRAPKACDNPSEPLNEIPFLIQYNMYFGNKSGTWDQCHLVKDSSRYFI